MNAKLITSIILTGLAVIFIFQNAAMVELRFLFWTLPTSMTLTMFTRICFAVVRKNFFFVVFG